MGLDRFDSEVTPLADPHWTPVQLRAGPPKEKETTPEGSSLNSCVHAAGLATWRRYFCGGVWSQHQTTAAMYPMVNNTMATEIAISISSS